MKSLEPKILTCLCKRKSPTIEGLLNHDFEEHVNGGFTHVSHVSKASRRKKNLTTTRGSFSATFVGSPTPVRTDSSTTQKRDCLAPGDSFYGFEEVKLEDHVRYLEKLARFLHNDQDRAESSGILGFPGFWNV